MPNFTYRAIIETFEVLLNEYPFDKITVSMVYRRCGISHNTFYYHFRDIYDLLEHWLEAKFKEVFSKDKEFKNKIKDLFQLCVDNERSLNHLFDSISREMVEVYFYRESRNLYQPYLLDLPGADHLSKESQETILRLGSYVFIGRMIRFIWSGMKEDVNEIAEEFERFLLIYVRAALEEGDSSFGTDL